MKEMEKILTLTALAKMMKIPRQQLYNYVNAKRILPDYVDEMGVRFWKEPSAKRLSEAIESQRAFPPRVRRQFENY